MIICNLFLNIYLFIYIMIWLLVTSDIGWIIILSYKMNALEIRKSLFPEELSHFNSMVNNQLINLVCMGIFRSYPICLHSVFYNIVNYIITQ